MAATSAEVPQPLPPLHGAPLVLLTIAVAFSTFMEILDMTIVNVAVPHIAGSLGVSPNEGTWAISSYSLASAIMQPLTGWLAKRFGEVKTFCFSVFLFVAVLHAVRPGHQHADAGGFPPAAGRRLRPDGRAVAVPAAVQLPEDQTGHRPGDVGDDRGRRTDLRADPRRLADRQLLVALDLLHQRAGWRARRA